MVSAVVEQLVDVASLTLTAVIGVVLLRVTLVLATPERVLVGGVLNEEAMLVVAVDNDAESEEVTTASPALAALAAVVVAAGALLVIELTTVVAGLRFTVDANSVWSLSTSLGLASN